MVHRQTDISDHPTFALLQSGADFFPALRTAIDGAKQTVYLETYLFAQDASADLIKHALIQAAQRGVQVYVMVDGYGSGEQGRMLVAQLQTQGVHASSYRPQRWWYLSVFLSPVLLRRLHRKLCVIDNQVGFVGGINIVDDLNQFTDQVPELGPRFDFAVRVEGAVVQEIQHAMQVLHRQAPPIRYSLPTVWDNSVAFLARDNYFNRQILERMYLKLLAHAQQEVWIANAYFLPGRRLRKALVACAKRGVQVNVLLQGRSEYALQHYATQALYGQLLDAGINIYEYKYSFLHAKVAVIDSQRATVGSSNIDPFSLYFAREANLLINDERFASSLRTALIMASQNQAQPILLTRARPLWLRALHWCAYAIVKAASAIFTKQHF